MSDVQNAYIGLGGNLGDVAASIRSACQRLAAHPAISVEAISGLYRSRPMGPENQPDYINAVAAITTGLSPLELLSVLQAIELEHGRVRGELQWGPRTLDLDLLTFADVTLQTAVLTLPHPGLTQREFVLYPLAEIATENLELPGLGVLSDWLRRCPLNGLERFASV